MKDVRESLDEVFQSTHLHEVRCPRSVRSSSAVGFQSTHLHEVRYRGVGTGSTIRDFNPRTYTRCDLVSDWAHRSSLRFQSTHLHEVRCQANSNAFVNSVFQSTHLHEVRYRSVGRREVLRDFNPRTYTRCDSRF